MYSLPDAARFEQTQADVRLSRTSNTRGNRRGADRRREHPAEFESRTGRIRGMMTRIFREGWDGSFGYRPMGLDVRNALFGNLHLNWAGARHGSTPKASRIARAGEAFIRLSWKSTSCPSWEYS